MALLAHDAMQVLCQVSQILSARDAGLHIGNLCMSAWGAAFIAQWRLLSGARYASHALANFLYDKSTTRFSARELPYKHPVAKFARTSTLSVQFVFVGMACEQEMIEQQQEKESFALWLTSVDKARVLSLIGRSVRHPLWHVSGHNETSNMVHGNCGDPCRSKCR